MHFLSLTATTLLTAALAVRGSPVPQTHTLASRAPNFFVLSGTAPNPATGTIDDEVCTPAQVTAIKNGIADAKKMADVAIRILGVKNMQKSNGFFQIFDTATPAEIKKKFEFVNNLGEPTEIQSTAQITNTATDLVFTCVQNPERAFIANTINVGTNSAPVNAIRFSAASLLNTLSSTAAASAFRTSATIQDAFQVHGGLPIPTVGFTFVHEVQHSNPLLGANFDIEHLVDKKIAGTRAYGFQQIQNLAGGDKKLNPQNYAFFALVAESNPEYFSPNCFISDRIPNTPPAPTTRRSVSEFVADLWSRAIKKAPAVAKPVVKPVVKPVPVAKPVAAPPAAKPAAKSPVAAPPAKAPITPPAPAKVPTTPPAPAKAPAQAPAKTAPTTNAPPAKAPVKAPVASAPVQAPVKSATKASASALAPKASASAAAAATCKLSAKDCASCKKIANGIPSDIKFPDTAFD